MGVDDALKRYGARNSWSFCSRDNFGAGLKTIFPLHLLRPGYLLASGQTAPRRVGYTSMCAASHPPTSQLGGTSAIALPLDVPRLFLYAP